MGSLSYLGGAIWLNGNSIVWINNTIFLENKVCFNHTLIISGIGGSIFFSAFDNSQIIISDSLFINNSAFYYGSSIVSQAQLNLKNCSFTNNLDNSNMTILAYPIDIAMNFNISLITFKSGQTFQIFFTLIDSLNQTLIFDDSSVAQIQIRNDLNILLKTDISVTNNLAKVKKGVLHFPLLLIKSDSDSKLQLFIYLQFNCDISGSPKSLKKTLDLYALPCQKGEIFKSDKSCILCGPNTYSLEKPSLDILQKCLICPDNAHCIGGVYIFPDHGYWRRSNESSLIIKCLISDACTNNFDLDQYNNNSDENLPSSMCAEGHEGNMCFDCQMGYGQFSNGQLCAKCQDINYLIILRLILVSFTIICYIFFNSKSMIQDSNENINNIVMKIVINHLQRTSIIVVFDVEVLVDSMQQFFRFLNFFSFLTEDLYSNSCFLQLLQIYNVKLYNIEVIFSLFITISFDSPFFVLFNNN